MSAILTKSAALHEHIQTISQPAGKQHFMKTAAAFANGAGGTIFIGPCTSDISEHDEISRLIRWTDICLLKSFSSSIAHCTTTEAVCGSVTVRIDIFPGASTPYFIQSANLAGKTFIRIGSETLPASETVLKELELYRTHSTWDRKTANNSTPLTEDRIQRLCHLLQNEARKAHSIGETAAITTQALTDCGLLIQKDDGLHPSNGFLLLEGRCGNLMEAGIQCGLYLGTSDVLIGDMKSFSGGLLDQFHEAENWLLSKLESRLLLDSEHTSIPEVPTAAVRALLVNAFCCRSYLVSDSPLQVAVYKNRIVITTPGGLPPGLSMDALLNGRNAFRNPAIARAFAFAGLMTPWQSPVLRARQAMKAWGLPPPAFEEKDGALYFEIRRPGDVAVSSDQLRDILSFDATSTTTAEASAFEATIDDASGCSDRGRRILQLIAADSSITTQELMSGLELTEGQVKFELKKLKAARLLAREGTKKGRWQILEGLPTAPA